MTSNQIPDSIEPFFQAIKSRNVTAVGDYIKSHPNQRVAIYSFNNETPVECLLRSMLNTSAPDTIAIFNLLADSDSDVLKNYGTFFGYRDNLIQMTLEQLFKLPDPVQFIPIIKQYVDLGLDCSKKDQEGNTPIHLLLQAAKQASQNAQVPFLEVAQYMATNGQNVDLNIKNVNGQTVTELYPGLLTIQPTPYEAKPPTEMPLLPVKNEIVINRDAQIQSYLRDKNNLIFNFNGKTVGMKRNELQAEDSRNKIHYECKIINSSGGNVTLDLLGENPSPLFFIPIPGRDVYVELKELQSVINGTRQVFNLREVRQMKYTAVISAINNGNEITNGEDIKIEGPNDRCQEGSEKTLCTIY